MAYLPVPRASDGQEHDSCPHRHDHNGTGSIAIQGVFWYVYQAILCARPIPENDYLKNQFT